MKKVLMLAALIVPVFAQTHELGFTLGGLAATNRGPVESQTGVALQANYGFRFVGNSTAALFGEVHMLASPLRDVIPDLRLQGATRDYASLYVTPGLRLKLNPKGRIQPYGVIGGGYALYEHSRLTFGGPVNPVARHKTTGAFEFGGGVDIPIFRWIALRGEVRDFYTGTPLYNVSGVDGAQHNIVAGGGFVLRFGN